MRTDIPIPALRPAEETIVQDWSRLKQHLAGLGMVLDLSVAPRQFAGGFANLNYLLRLDGKDVVLRRPPLGPLPPGAYDMGRESRILSQLWRQFPLAPRSLHFCEDAKVLGAPFQLSEYRRGISLRDTLPPALSGDVTVASRLGAMLTRVLADLHRVDPAAVGLQRLGKPEGFITRAIEGWDKRARLAVAEWATPAMLQLIEELSSWLRAQRIPSGRVTLLHNDFKLDNVLLDPQSLEPIAVLDWDQGTRGDPLFDLATLLSYWSEAGDPPAMHLMAQMPTAQPGFPSCEAAAQAYARACDADLSSFQLYRVLAGLKTAVIFAQLHGRYREGGTQDPRYARFSELSEGLLLFARDIAQGRRF